MDITSDGPTGTRTTIKFANQPHGLFISGDKLRIDAKNFRLAARLLNAAGGEQEARLAAWFVIYADQCLNAAGGMEAVQQPAPYDRDVGLEVHNT